VQRQRYRAVPQFTSANNVHVSIQNMSLNKNVYRCSQNINWNVPRAGPELIIYALQPPLQIDREHAASHEISRFQNLENWYILRMIRGVNNAGQWGLPVVLPGAAGQRC
jgi:hypothetical protein